MATETFTGWAPSQVLGGYSQTRFSIGARSSSGDSDDYHVGAYGGVRAGPLKAAFGAAYSWRNLSTTRAVGFAGFADADKAAQAAGVAQVFGELGLPMGGAARSIEPFVGLAYVNLHGDGFSETGGAAALKSAGGDSGTTFATVGLRGRGKDHIKEITGQPNVELVALCDIDQKVLDAAASNVETITGGTGGKATGTDAKVEVNGAAASAQGLDVTYRDQNIDVNFQLSTAPSRPAVRPSRSPARRSPGTPSSPISIWACRSHAARGWRSTMTAWPVRTRATRASSSA